MMWDGLIGTWYGDNSWSIATWTLSIELIATYFIYLLAQTVAAYEGKNTLYFLVIVFSSLPWYLNKYGKYNYQFSTMAEHMPMFFIGTWICHLEV